LFNILRFSLSLGRSQVFASRTGFFSHYQSGRITKLLSIRGRLVSSRFSRHISKHKRGCPGAIIRNTFLFCNGHRPFIALIENKAYQVWFRGIAKKISPWSCIEQFQKSKLLQEVKNNKNIMVKYLSADYDSMFDGFVKS
jgi:hypothetical protein